MKRQNVILIVEDEKHTREGLRDSLDESFDVYVAADVEGALAVLEAEPVDAVVTDLRLGTRDGMELLDLALARKQAPVCIMMTAYGSVDTAVEAMKRGAYDFVTKPVNIDRLELLIRRALRERNTRRENEELRERAGRKFDLEGMIGQSERMMRIFDTIRQVAPSRATVLIEGESGTGKELAARAIHDLSQRANGKFIAVHCAALSPQLLESELFGHERGAFTGATERRIGRFEQAAGGTLFLDEIGEIDLTTQVKILRVLGERTFERVGGNQTLQADVRLVAATNRNLGDLVKEGKFRDDLFFRLNVVRLTMPPLRERREDIPLLVQSFLRDSSEENAKPFREMTPEAMDSLLEYGWPGNVRELRAAIEHGVVMAQGPRITLRDLPEPLRANSGGKTGAAPAPGGDSFNLDQHERTLIIQALKATDGSRTQAARKLGISRRTLHRKLKELDID